jgi:hypothetical protein
VRGDAEEQALQHAGQGEGEGEPGHHTDGDQGEPSAQDHAQDVAALGPDRHADPDLLRALSDRIRDHAVEPERGQREGEGREQAEQPRDQPARGDGVVDEAIELVELARRQTGIIGGEGGAHVGDEGLGRPAAAARPSPSPALVDLSVSRYISLSPCSLERAVTDVGHDPDDSRAATLRHHPAHGVLTGPEAVGQVLVDDDGLLRAGVVALVEEPSRPQGDAHHLKVVVVDDPWIGERVLPLRIPDALRPRAPGAVPPQGQAVAEAHPFDAGQRRDPLHGAVEVLHGLLRARERARRVEPPRHGAPWLEARAGPAGGR